MKKSGAEILIQSLANENVEVMFGYPGGVLLDIYDKLFDSKIRHILMRHEQAAAHAADGYARATGKVGVCIATSGPGATNLVTGIATAYMDSVPMVAFTGQVPTPLIGGDAFQEADIIGITRPITKHSYLVKDVKDLAGIIKDAFHIARTGRPGPVLIDIPKDVAIDTCNYEYPEKASARGYNPVKVGNKAQVKRAADMIARAKQPIIYAGGGVIISGASDTLIKFAEKYKIPVTATLLGLGGFPGDHPLFLGMLGMHGTYYANMAISNSDLIIALGARFDDRVTGKIEEFAPNATIVHIDIDPSAISKNVTVHIPIVGDARVVLDQISEQMNETAKTKGTWLKPREKWLKQINSWKREHPLSYSNHDKIIKPQFVIEKIFELTKGDAIITTEVGQNQMWTAHYYKFLKPRTILSSGGLGTMGYGLPAAIGAQVAYPDKTVIDIAGDGSIQMNMQELATAVQNRLPIKIAILNNHFLGMVRQWQELFYDKRYSHTCLMSEPNFVMLAEAYGAHGFNIKKPADVEPTLRKALKIKGPVLMNFEVAREENVFPMVPAGEAISNMIFENPKKEKRKPKVVK